MLFEDLKEKLNDTRHFVDFPEVIFFDEFADYVEELPGAEIIRFELDGTIEMWLEFTYSENRFFVKNKFGDYQFFVEDKKCPDYILMEIADHFRKLLEKDDSAIENAEFIEGSH